MQADKPLTASEQKLKKLFVFCMGINKPPMVMIVPAIFPGRKISELFALHTIQYWPRTEEG
jgi:hypothetical protein